MKVDLTAIINGVRKQLSFDIPTGWSQVKFKHLIELRKPGIDTTKAISIFTDLEEQVIKTAKIHNMNQVLACLSFLNTELTYTLPVKISGYNIAPNLDFESIAQYTDLQDIIKEFKKDDNIHNLSFFPMIVATYCVEPYDYKEAEKIKDQFNNAPCTEVLAVANFTLVKLHALSSGILPTCPQGDTLMNRFKQALRLWLNNLGITIRFYLWKKSLPSSERNFLNGR